MKPIKMLGLAALLALLAMAVLGASSAMAEGTQLCSVDETPCEGENIVTHVHETTLKGAKATLLNSISNVLCEVLFLGETLPEEATEGPELIHGNFTYSECVDEKPNSCTVAEENGPVTIVVLKTGHEAAEVTGKGEVKVVCSGISCLYNGEGLKGTATGPLLSTETNGDVTITEQTTKKVKGLLCPSTAKLDITVTPLEKTFISQPAGHYCVRYQNTRGNYLLGPSRTECKTFDAARLGFYQLVWGPPGLASGTMVCVLGRAPELYLLVRDAATEECLTKDENPVGWYELGEIV